MITRWNHVDDRLPGEGETVMVLRWRYSGERLERREEWVETGFLDSKYGKTWRRARDENLLRHVQMWAYMPRLEERPRKQPFVRKDATEEEIEALIKAGGDDPERVAAGVRKVIDRALGDYRKNEDPKEDA